MRARTASLVVLPLAACANTLDISQQPLAGTVGGDPWTFADGVFGGSPDGEDDFIAYLYPMPIDLCGFVLPRGDQLQVSVPKTPGEYEFSTVRRAMFVTGGDYLVASEGRIIVHSLTATEVAAGLHVVYDGENEVDGQFTVTRCPP